MLDDHKYCYLNRANEGGLYFIYMIEIERNRVYGKQWAFALAPHLPITHSPKKNTTTEIVSVFGKKKTLEIAIISLYNMLIC